ncbi:hypothetical protein Rhopal_002183-T1 [Rhodotorula paludigena]|uniref:Uncharacterized protein n=1 Tax=Rhodotorula paludigena TaxID=86838 RepID=A0AAV5GI83_9BASI|nr:hypothetical protein Rhopal_002183-T1 [Rhodotorula paludigena]
MSVIAPPPTAFGDDLAWHREGPVRMLQQGLWKRRNNPVACDIQVAGSRRGTDCVVGDDIYSPTAPTQTTIFISVLPPPAVPCPTPCATTSPSWKLDADALHDSLATIQPRPAPLVWKSPNETLTTSTGSARLRQRRAVDYSKPLGSGHPRYGVGPAWTPSVSRKRSSPSDGSEAHESAADDAYIPPLHCSPRRVKRAPHWPASGSSTPASRRASLDSTGSGSAGSTAATTVYDGPVGARARAPEG